MLNDKSDQIRDFTAQALEAISTVEARSALDRYRSNEKQPFKQ